MNDDELTSLLRENATRYKASEKLRASVRTQVALQTAAANDTNTHLGFFTRGWRSIRWTAFGSRSALSGFACGVALTLALSLLAPRFMLSASMPAELVSRHVHALKVGPLIEVASNDRHTVKPWFQGKLDYAPPVVDLQSDGFPLLGGRVERVAGAPVATLAYASRKHIINVFVWPTDDVSVPKRMQKSGFNLMHWGDGSMQVWVVSDLDSGEIERFGEAWRSSLPVR
jgi:anti-sigma factor RsiW